MMSSQVLSQKSTENSFENGKARYSKVMLIDDNSLDIFINRKMIESSGFAEQVTSYQDAQEALQFLNQCDPSAWPEVIFLDIIMPQMDGFAFLDEFGKLPEEMRKAIRIVMLSTSESFKDLNRANKNPHVRKFLNKPLTAQMLMAIQA